MEKPDQDQVRKPLFLMGATRTEKISPPSFTRTFAEVVRPPLSLVSQTDEAREAAPPPEQSRDHAPSGGETADAAPPPAPPPSPPPRVQQPVAGGDAPGTPASLVRNPPPATRKRTRSEMLDRLAASVQTLRLESNRLASLARADALEIGFLVARRILETEISTNPEALFSLVRSALRRVGESRDITIRLHPADASAVRQAEGTVLPQGPSISQIRLVGDPSLSPGDCVIDTEMGSFDGRLESRLAQLRRAASGAIGERS